MRAVILGSQGQLGNELTRQLPGATAFARADLDVTDAVKVREALAAARPDVVFNATSNNRVDAAESDPGPAFAVNALAVRSLALVCSDLNCRLVHFSTNYVFGRDAERRRPYLEVDSVGPINAYGVSKLTGEDFVLTADPRSLVVRTAALFGLSTRSRHNFLENMLAKARAGEVVRIVNDQTIAPIATADLAAATIGLVRADAAGVFHVNGPEATTWYELARVFFECAGLSNRVRPVSSAEIAAAARRPSYSVMGIDKYLSLGFAAPRAWREAVKDYWMARGGD
jgi:dTDP-4-dehydrorhamnose reductase